MAQEDFAKLGFEIDAKGAKAAFTAIMKRLDALDAKTVEVSKHIGQQMSAAFDSGRISLILGLTSLWMALWNLLGKRPRQLAMLGKSLILILPIMKQKKFQTVLAEIITKITSAQKVRIYGSLMTRTLLP